MSQDAFTACQDCPRKPCTRLSYGRCTQPLRLEFGDNVPKACPARLPRPLHPQEWEALGRALEENLLRRILVEVTPVPALAFSSNSARRAAAVRAVASGRVPLLYAPPGSHAYRYVSRWIEEKHKAWARIHRKTVEAEAEHVPEAAQKEPEPQLVRAAWVQAGKNAASDPEIESAAPLEAVGCKVETQGLSYGDQILFHVYLKSKGGTAKEKFDTLVGRVGEKTSKHNAVARLTLPQHKGGRVLEAGQALYFEARYTKLNLQCISPILRFSAPPKPEEKPSLHLSHRYHDDTPVVGAAYEVELENHAVLKGRLNEEGQAEIQGLPAQPIQVRYGPDSRPYAIVNDDGNPAYTAHFTEAEAQAQVATAQAGAASSEAAKAYALEAVDWIWGVVQGGFNAKQTVSQIVVDAVIGMIPLVGDVTAVRDLVALILGMAQEPKKRESKAEWLALTVLLFALIPVFGGTLKGIGRLLLREMKDAEEAAHLLKEMMGVLNRMGLGDAVKWLRELDLVRYVEPLLGLWRELIRRLMQVLEAIPPRLQALLSPRMREHLVQLKQGLETVLHQGLERIPEAVKDLHARLKQAQRHLYTGEWHAIPKNLSSKTWETEARLVWGPGSRKWVVEKMQHPQNGKEMFVKQEGWPNLKDKKYVKTDRNKKATNKVIPCFSGPMRAVKIPRGIKIYRVVKESGGELGSWWFLALPETGKEWRENLAVLDSFNSNGYYVEMTVPEEGLLAWEGKASGQVENDPEAAATLGQYLPGGSTQLFIDMEFKANKNALENMAKKMDKDVSQLPEKKPTHWTDYMGLHVPEKVAKGDFLAPMELAEKSTRPHRTQRSGEKME